MDIRSWRLQAKRVVYQDRWVEVALADVQLPTGQAYTYTVLRRVPGAAVVALNGRQEVLVQREYRYPLDAVVYQLPGGLVDAGESPLETARRELREETGYEAEEWELLGTVQDNPGLIDGATTLFLAQRLRPASTAQPEQAEFVTSEWRPLSWLRERILAGEIEDRVLLAAFAFLAARGLIPER